MDPDGCFYLFVEICVFNGDGCRRGQLSKKPLAVIRMQMHFLKD